MWNWEQVINQTKKNHKLFHSPFLGLGGYICPVGFCRKLIELNLDLNN